MGAQLAMLALCAYLIASLSIASHVTHRSIVCANEGFVAKILQICCKRICMMAITDDTCFFNLLCVMGVESTSVLFVVPLDV